MLPATVPKSILSVSVRKSFSVSNASGRFVAGVSLAVALKESEPLPSINNISCRAQQIATNNPTFSLLFNLMNGTFQGFRKCQTNRTGLRDP